MEKRYEENAFRRVLKLVENATGAVITEDQLQVAAHGAEEQELVHSGLEETMSNAYHEIRALRLKLGAQKIDLRTASFVDAINKIASCYGDMGIFP